MPITAIARIAPRQHLYELSLLFIFLLILEASIDISHVLDLTDFLAVSKVEVLGGGVVDAQVGHYARLVFVKHGLVEVTSASLAI